MSIGLTVDKVTFVRSTMKPRLFSNLGLRPRYEKRLCFMVSVRNDYYWVFHPNSKGAGPTPRFRFWSPKTKMELVKKPVKILRAIFTNSKTLNSQLQRVGIGPTRNLAGTRKIIERALIERRSRLLQGQVPNESSVSREASASSIQRRRL